MSSDQLFNILVSLLFIGIAFSLTYYQPLLNTAPRTQITCFLISFLLSNRSISRTLVQLLGDEGHVILSTHIPLLPCKAAAWLQQLLETQTVKWDIQEMNSTFHWLPLKI